MMLSRISTLLTLASLQTKVEEAAKIELGEVRALHPEYEVPKFLRQSPDGRTVRQSEKRAQKQAMKDRRRAFRHSVDKQNKIAKAVDVRNKPQQARMSEIAEESL